MITFERLYKKIFNDILLKKLNIENETKFVQSMFEEDLIKID